jgi:hypothetical protein
VPSWLELFDSKPPFVLVSRIIVTRATHIEYQPKTIIENVWCLWETIHRSPLYILAASSMPHSLQSGYSSQQAAVRDNQTVGYAAVDVRCPLLLRCCLYSWWCKPTSHPLLPLPLPSTSPRCHIHKFRLTCKFMFNLPLKRLNLNARHLRGLLERLEYQVQPDPQLIQLRTSA